jgi:hypothetical protein
MNWSDWLDLPTRPIDQVYPIILTLSFLVVNINIVRSLVINTRIDGNDLCSFVVNQHTYYLSQFSNLASFTCCKSVRVLAFTLLLCFTTTNYTTTFTLLLCFTTTNYTTRVHPSLISVLIMFNDVVRD